MRTRRHEDNRYCALSQPEEHQTTPCMFTWALSENACGKLQVQFYGPIKPVRNKNQMESHSLDMPRCSDNETSFLLTFLRTILRSFDTVQKSRIHGSNFQVGAVTELEDSAHTGSSHHCWGLTLRLADADQVGLKQWCRQVGKTINR